MQPLARDGFTPAQVTALLTAPDLEVDFGLDLLDPALGFVEDISADVSGWNVRRNNLADVHATVDLVISRALAWGFDRVRPFMLLSSPTVGVSNVRFQLGVYLMQTPDTALGEEPATFAVTGYDQLHLLQDCIGDSYTVPAGANVLDAVRAVLTAAGILAPVLLDTTGSAKVLAAVMVWPLTSSTSPTWMGVANDLLAAIGYRGLWCDQDGAFRSGPYVLPSDRPSEWRFSVGDLVTGIVAQDRTAVQDLWGIPNWMRCVRNMDTPPVEGAGMYTMTNASSGPSSVASVGRTVRAPVTFLDAVDQASLVIQGDRLFAAATRVSEVITLKLSPWPVAWHFDRAEYADPALGADRQVQCRSWSLSSGGADMDYAVETI